MRLLLDESLPRQLAARLSDHEVSTVHREGWAGTKNGELLRRANDRFDVLITGDRNLQHQQNRIGIQLGIIVVAARDNRVATITAMAPAILAALTRVRSGEVVIVTA